MQLDRESLLKLLPCYVCGDLPDEMVDQVKQAVEADPEWPEAWNNLGVLLMEQGETAEAVQIFKRAFALDNGESTSIRDNLRLALAKLENPDTVPLEQDYKLVRRGSSDFVIRNAE